MPNTITSTPALRAGRRQGPASDGLLHDSTAGGSRTTSRLRSWILGAAQATLGIGVLAWLLLSGAFNWDAISRLLDAAWVVPAAGACCAVTFVFMALRLQVFMRACELDLSLAASFRLTVTSVFFSWCIPGGSGGDLVKMYYLGRWNPGRTTEAVTVTLWDRAVGLSTLLILALVAAAFAPARLIGERVLTSLLFACAGLLLLGAVTLALALGVDWSKRRPFSRPRRLGRVGQTLLRVFQVVHGYRRRPGALLAGIGFSLCAQVFLLAGAFLLAGVVASDGADPVMLVLMPLGYVANALPITPGGLGVGEAAFEQLFKLAGLSGGADVALSWRAVAMLASLPGLWFYLRTRSSVPSPTSPLPEPTVRGRDPARPRPFRRSQQDKALIVR